MPALPTPFLYKLKIPMRKKVVLLVMFTLGIMCVPPTLEVPCLAMLTGLFRQDLRHLYLPPSHPPSMEFADMTHSGLHAILFSALEPR